MTEKKVTVEATYSLIAGNYILITNVNQSFLIQTALQAVIYYLFLMFLHNF